MEKSYFPEIHVIQDREILTLFYACIKSKYDRDGEFSIFASGQSEQEAWQNAISELINCINRCHDTLENILKNISEKRDHLVSQDLFLPYHYINIENKGSEYKMEKFDALTYDKQKDKWYRYYR